MLVGLATAGNRTLVRDALSPLAEAKAGVAVATTSTSASALPGGKGAAAAVTGGEGAIYFWARLPDGIEDDEKVWAECLCG